jgi:hypothetical protein
VASGEKDASQVRTYKYLPDWVLPPGIARFASKQYPGYEINAPSVPSSIRNITYLGMDKDGEMKFGVDFAEKNAARRYKNGKEISGEKGK